MDDRFRLRPRSRLRLLIRPARDAAVRRLSFARLAARVQCRRRAWATARARVSHSGAGRTHRLALDDRARGAVEAIPAPCAQRLASGRRYALADADADPCRLCLDGLLGAPSPGGAKK